MTDLDLQAQMASIDRALAEAMRAREEAMNIIAERPHIEGLREAERAKMEAERRRIDALRQVEYDRMNAERLRIEELQSSERAKMDAETRRLLRQASLEPWQVIIPAMAAGAALLAAGGALVKLLGP